MDITTNWVKPPTQITGLDHLGVQAPCINIYAQLLPGITNVTDRARYYSFYPWLIMAMDKAGYSYDDEFIDTFRRADVLFTLICLQHKNNCENGNHHIDAAVGSIVLNKALKELVGNNLITLSSYASREASSKRYFMNKLGGLGQYYLGVLRSLNLIDGNAREGVKAIKDMAMVFANHFVDKPPADNFMRIVKADAVSLADLDDLYPFCLCQLNENTIEQKAMVELFSGKGKFSGKDINTDKDSSRRSKSLLYILQLVEVTNEHGLEFNIETFRGLTYCHALDRNIVLTIDKNIHTVTGGWAAYQRNELFSIALQGLFNACLRAYELSGLTFQSVNEMSKWFWQKSSGAKVLGTFKTAKTFEDLKKQLMITMPTFEDWQQENHEIDCMNQLHQLSREKLINTESLETMVLCSLRILSALAEREQNKSGYGELYFPHGYFDYYPVNLRSFQHYLGKGTLGWSQLPVEECLSKVLSDWCLNAHLKVALRKLRLQSQSTFRFMPTDNGLTIIDIPKVAHTQPRFRQARTILTDIGLLYWDDNGLLKPTENAMELLKIEDGAA